MKIINKVMFLFKFIIKKISKKTLLIILSFLLITSFLSWPLVLNLDGFLLSQHYKDISHADTNHHIFYL